MNQPTIEYRGDVWRVLGVGANNGADSFVHLASTTQFRQQRNGLNPIQINDWLPNGQLTGRTFINLGFAKVYARNVGGHVVALESVL